MQNLYKKCKPHRIKENFKGFKCYDCIKNRMSAKWCGKNCSEYPSNKIK